MNFLRNICQSFSDLLIKLSELNKRKKQLFGGVFCKKAVLRNFAKFLKTPIFKNTSGGCF